MYPQKLHEADFQLSYGTLAILSEVFEGFPQSLQINTRVVLRLRHEPFPSKFFSIHPTTGEYIV
jgi:hypothetical protein